MQLRGVAGRQVGGGGSRIQVGPIAGGAVALAVFLGDPKDEVAWLVGPRAGRAPFDGSDGLTRARRVNQPAGVVIGEADGERAKRVGERGGDEGIVQDAGQLFAAERSRWAPVRGCARGRMPGLDFVPFGLGVEPREGA